MATEAERGLKAIWPMLVLPVLALLLVLPLLLHGPSCGHDFGFHMQSWMDAGAQMRRGDLLPRWAYSPAFNAGEPRFMFYPPLSWVLGSVLLLALPSEVVPAVFTILALTLAGWGMWALARRFAHAAGALLAAAVYLANPYMLFTAFERTAYAELLAAAWMPWLLRAALAERVQVLPVAVPLALLWLTNAPAAVMGTYALGLVVCLRAWLRWWRGRQSGTGLRGVGSLVGPAVGGLVLGLALAGFYLLPAALERRYVQIAMAIIPNMRVEDNFLFGHTGYGPHDVVLHTASVVALLVMGLTACALILAWWGGRTQAVREHGRDVLTVLALLAAVIALLFIKVSLPAWHVLPELAFLQFPWRWLAVLGCVLGVGVALLIGRLRVPAAIWVGTALGIAALAGPVEIRPFREGCEAHELPAERVALFAAQHGVGPTDEYTPSNADNDQLRWDDPAWWLTTDANAPGPGTVPNPAATIENYDEPPPLDQTVSGRAPMHLQVAVPRAEDLVLNLRDYPAWAVTVNGARLPHLQRDDGLIAVALPPGLDTVDVRWRRLPDVWAGDAMSLCALGMAGWWWVRS